MTWVVDASAMVALLVDTGNDGSWAKAFTVQGDLHAPHLMPVEVAETLRRRSLRNAAESALTRQAHQLLGRMPILLHPYLHLADRVWELRDNVSAYDAWYVALAEALDAPLVTLDRRLRRATGPRCAFAAPPPAG